MICRRCGKDVVGTDKCLYCGKVLDGFLNMASGDEGAAVAAPNDGSEGQAGGALSGYRDYDSTYGAGGYDGTNYADYDENAPDDFYQQYKKNSVWVKITTVLAILNIIPALGMILVAVATIYAIHVDAGFLFDLFLKVFHFDALQATNQENFEFALKLLTIFTAICFTPSLLNGMIGICNWLAMKGFAAEVQRSGIDGDSLLAPYSPSGNKRNKDDYRFISHALCLIDVPSHRHAIGAQAMIRVILDMAGIAATMNLISYLSLTLMPMLEGPEELLLTMFTSTEFWLNPNVLCFMIALWGALIINAITGAIVNGKYNRWIKNKRAKGE